MRVEVLFTGFPGKLRTGFMEWSSVVYFESGGKKVLFDTGGTGKRITLLPRLAEAGAKPEDIDILVFSHFHADHVYNFQYFPNARIIMHKKEAAWAEKGEDVIQPPFFYEAVKATGRLETVDEGAEIAPGATALHLPGHTPGCLGLLLSARDMPKTVLAGDAIKNLLELATGNAGMSLDPVATARSAAKVRSLAERVIPGHDRVLRVDKDRCYAEDFVHETIVIPGGVLQKGERCIDLVLEQTSLAVQE
jgi:glyoxylase-like metal-dependent hydrolase (beta-lactamase superfamily II)